MSLKINPPEAHITLILSDDIKLKSFLDSERDYKKIFVNVKNTRSWYKIIFFFCKNEYYFIDIETYEAIPTNETQIEHVISKNSAIYSFFLRIN